YRNDHNLSLPSFPTRRSSDLRLRLVGTMRLVRPRPLPGDDHDQWRGHADEDQDRLGLPVRERHTESDEHTDHRGDSSGDGGGGDDGFTLHESWSFLDGMMT